MVKVVLWLFFDEFRPMYEIALILVNIATFFISIKFVKVGLESHITKMRGAFIMVYLN
ncbi:MAG: hypothetical protein LBU60_04530 [Clostridiales bacterium]|jgi:hypothetical protein|nr:hypothetical protein [Clostridiales bacterium]